MTEQQLAASFALRGSKVITGRPFLPGDAFTFEVTAPPGAPLPANPTVTITPRVGQIADIDFGRISFTARDVNQEFVYTIVEVQEDAAGFTYDAHTEYVTLRVMEGEGGAAQVAARYGADGTGRGILFSSTYHAHGTAEIDVIKDLQGRDWTDRDEFFFDIGAKGRGTYEFGAYEYVDGGMDVPLPLNPRTSATHGGGEVAHRQHFAEPWNIGYSITDLAVDPIDGVMKGDFFYEMREVCPPGAIENPDGTHTYQDIIYTNAVHTAHVHVEDNRRGQLVTSVHYDETELGDATTAQRRTPVYANRCTIVPQAVAKEVYTVAFVDGHSGQIVKAESVEAGGDALAPEAPEHPGFLFREWVGSVSKIERDGVVVATYMPDLSAIEGLDPSQFPGA